MNDSRRNTSTLSNSNRNKPKIPTTEQKLSKGTEGSPPKPGGSNHQSPPLPSTSSPTQPDQLPSANTSMDLQDYAPPIELTKLNTVQMLKDMFSYFTKKETGSKQKARNIYESLLPILEKSSAALLNLEAQNKALKKHLTKYSQEHLDIKEITKQAVREELERFSSQQQSTHNISKSTALQQNEPVSYAAAAGNKAPNSQVRRRTPAVILNGKSEEITPTDIRRRLNSLPHHSLAIREIFSTRSGSVVIKCNTDTDLDKVQELLANNEEIKEVATVRKSQPPRKRIIIMNVPDTAEDEEVCHKIKSNYLTEAVPTHIKKFQARSGTFHHVVDLPLQEGQIGRAHV